MDEHKWSFVQFAFGSWMECSCGLRADSQSEMDAHIEEVRPA